MFLSWLALFLLSIKIIFPLYDGEMLMLTVDGKGYSQSILDKYVFMF